VHKNSRDIIGKENSWQHLRAPKKVKGPVKKKKNKRKMKKRGREKRQINK
jgi:hypothetical protein